MNEQITEFIILMLGIFLFLYFVIFILFQDIGPVIYVKEEENNKTNQARGK